MRVLAVADEVDESLTAGRLRELGAQIVLAAGDLPFDYLEYLVSTLDVPLVYVPGNHDPELRPALGLGPLTLAPPPPGPGGCLNADGRTVDAAGLRIAGLGGSLGQAARPNQYSQARMRRRALALEARARLRRALDGRGVDILLTHSPPLHAGDADDPAHRGFTAFQRLVRALEPRFLVHGHVHPYGRRPPPIRLGRSEVVNAVPHRLLEL